jgi:hypothetical protein
MAAFLSLELKSCVKKNLLKVRQSTGTIFGMRRQAATVAFSVFTHFGLVQPRAPCT